MRIGIDCRMYGLKHGGTGRYLQNLVENLLKIDKKNQYVLFIRADQEVKSQILKLRPLFSNFEIVAADYVHYGLKEQLFFPLLLYKQKLDLAHFPQFNFPIFYFGNFVVTIHDLIKHTSRGINTTTRNPLFYWLKYVGYKIVFKLAVKRAKIIFVPSRSVALQLIKAEKLSGERVVVTYEGVGINFLKTKTNFFQAEKILEKLQIKKPFLLYVGSVYPHKNIINLVKALKVLNWPGLKLVIVCARNVFWERLKKELKTLDALNEVNLVGFLPDEELAFLYSQAEAFVFPSLSEGFGLPGLEAIASGLPVLASEIPVFKEIYQDAALFFDPKDPQDIAQKIKKLLSDKNLQKKLKSRGMGIAAGYSWEKMAKETLDGYKKL